MKKFATVLLACLAASAGLMAHDDHKDCHCKNCSCTPEANCGCYSEKGCNCETNCTSCKHSS